jgi:hypothetical protein
MNPAVSEPMTSNELMTTNLRMNGNESMLMYESLARERMREAEQAANHSRLVRRVSSARRWERVSAWAAKRAQRAQEML